MTSSGGHLVFLQKLFLQKVKSEKESKLKGLELLSDLVCP